MARYAQLRNTIADAALPVLYRDASMDGGTLSLIRMDSVWAGGGADFPDEAQVKDMAFVYDHAVVSGALPFQGGGAVLNQAADDYVRLPAAFMLAPNLQHFMMTFWLRLDVDGQPGFNNSPISARSTVGGSDAFGTGQWHYLLTPTLDAQGVLTQLEWFQGGQTTVILDQLYRLFDDRPHQFAVETEVKGAEAVTRFYLDGAMVLQTPSRPYTPPVVPSPADRARVGVSVIHPASFGGRFYGARFDDLTKTVRDAPTILREDIAEVRGSIA